MYTFPQPNKEKGDINDIGWIIGAAVAGLGLCLLITGTTRADSNDKNALTAAVENYPEIKKLMANAGHVVFVIPGNDEDENLLGCAIRSGKFSLTYASDTVTPRHLAHELGHACGLGDEYTTVPFGDSIPGEDRDDLMNIGSGSRLRYEQWKTIRKNYEQRKK